MDITVLSKEVEKVSKLYAKQYGIKRNGEWFILKLQEEMGELIQSYLSRNGKGRSRGRSNSEIDKDFEKEVADVFCHTLLLARFYKINLERAIAEKWLKWIK